MRERYVEYLASITGAAFGCVYSHVFASAGGAHRLAYDASGVLPSI